MEPEEGPLGRPAHDPAPDIPPPPEEAEPADAVSRPMNVAILVASWVASALLVFWMSRFSMDPLATGEFVRLIAIPSLVVSVVLFLTLDGTHSARSPWGCWLIAGTVVIYTLSHLITVSFATAGA